jgi:hypothetical protein
MDNIPELCRIFKTIRGESTYREFADKLSQRGIKVNYSYLCKIEKGVRSPSRKLLSCISEMTGIAFIDLAKAKDRLDELNTVNKEIGSKTR